MHTRTQQDPRVSCRGLLAMHVCPHACVCRARVRARFELRMRMRLTRWPPCRTVSPRKKPHVGTAACQKTVRLDRRS